MATPPEVRVAVLGNVDSGKSTLIGVLVSGHMDNGRGLARKQVYTHRHEDETGRTSAVSLHIMGFDKNQAAVYQGVAASASSEKKNKGWAEVVSQSASVVSFIDLAGHEKYLKTTIAGLTGNFPDYTLVLVNSLAGITKMTKEHLGVVLALELPVCVVVTKVDLCPENVLKRTKVQLFKILRSPAAGRKMPVHVRELDDVKTVIESQVHNRSNHVIPVVHVSSVTGEGLDLLLAYIAALRPGRHAHLLGEGGGPSSAPTFAPPLPDPPPTHHPPLVSSGSAGDVKHEDESKQAAASSISAHGALAKDAEFQIDHTFQVPGTGLVVSGTLTRGVVQTNDQLWLGPIGAQGEFVQVLIRSIQTKRTPVDIASAEEGCVPYCFAIRVTKGKKEALKRTRIRRGMVLVAGESAAEVAVRASCRAFEAEIMVLHHHSTIKQDYQAVVHMGDVRQTAVIERIVLLDCVKPSSSPSSPRSSPTESGASASADAAGQPKERGPALRTGDRARIIFRFLFKPEYVRIGSLFLFREGSTKGVGRVTRKLTNEEAEETAALSKHAVEAARKAQGRAQGAAHPHKDPQ